MGGAGNQGPLSQEHVVTGGRIGPSQGGAGLVTGHGVAQGAGGGISTTHPFFFSPSQFRGGQHIDEVAPLLPLAVQLVGVPEGLLPASDGSVEGALKQDQAVGRWVQA
jgi:hypothetical protein